EDASEARSGAPPLHHALPLYRRRPPEDPLGRGPRAAAAARERARAARRAAEGPALRGNDGRAAAGPREGGGGLPGLALADRDPFLPAALERASPACPGVALGGDARRDLVAAHLPTLPSERRSVRGSRDVKGREQSQQ